METDRSQDEDQAKLLQGGDAMRQLYRLVQDEIAVGPHSFLVTASPGLVVDPDEYKNAYHPNNPQG